MKIIIIALRRSGSTIFWRCFREATNATSFDEPFNPKLFQLPKEHPKQNLGEFINLLNEEKDLFWNLFHPIYPQDELKKKLTYEQATYLKKILSLDKNVIIDSTRCWNKISSLKELSDPDTFLIHLHRAPASWVTSHLLPSEQKQLLLLNLKRKGTFWTRKYDFNRWNMEDVLGREFLSPFHLLFLKDDHLAEKFYDSSGAYRLLKFWSLAFQEIENNGKILFGDRFLSIRFEDFCSSPKKILGKVSDKTGISFNFNKLPNIKLPSQAFMSSSKNWQAAACYWNLPDNIEYLHRNINTDA